MQSKDLLMLNADLPKDDPPRRNRMKVKVKELIQKLHEFEPDADVAIEDLDDDQEYFIASFAPGDGRLTIVITDEEEEDEDIY